MPLGFSLYSAHKMETIDRFNFLFSSMIFGLENSSNFQIQSF